LVDPLGLLSSSRLINIDTHDELVLESANRLATLLAKLSDSGTSDTSRLQNLNTAELRRVATRVTRKLIARRSEVNSFSNKLFATILKQMAKKTTSDTDSNDSNMSLYQPSAIINNNDEDGQSSRLQNARDRLNDITTSQ